MSRYLAMLFVIFYFGVCGSVYALTFDFSGTLGSVDSCVFNVEGVSVVATAWTGDIARHVHQDANGLGVTFTGDRAMEGAAAQIDGRGYLESLVLTFNQPVLLNEIEFSYWEENDGYALDIDATDTVYTFSAPETDDDYKVRAIDVALAAPSAVPEAGSLSLLGIGLMSLVRRRLTI